jgi:release factor glutamine methyltransferase
MTISQRERHLLLQHVLGISRAELLTDSAKLQPHQQVEFEAFCARREAGEPIAKIIGKKSFWKHTFFTTTDTLDPRPESEHIIEAVLKHRPEKERAWRILDMGTGTGCLLLSLLHEYPNATGVGIDMSAQALTVAERNAVALSVQNRAQCMNLSWTEPLTSVYDIIITNPPYIPSEEIEHLDVDVRHYDPLSALDGGEDGLAAYRQIFQRLRGLLHDNGLFVCEIGINQHDDVSELAKKAGFHCIERITDLSDIVRVLVFHA